MKKTLIIAAALVALQLSVKAQIDTINAKNNKLQLQYLKAGTKNYLVYMSDTALNKRQVGDLWERKTTFTRLNGKQVVQFNPNYALENSKGKGI